MRSLRTKGNREKCLRMFPRFINWCRKHVDPKITPDAIRDSRISDLGLPLDDPKRWRWEDLVKQYYNEYYDRYEAEGKSTLSALTYFSVVQSFFKHHRLDLKYRKGELKVAETKRKKRVPELDEIRAMHNVAETWRDKALLLTLAQAGMSEVDAGEVNVEDVVDKLSKPPVYYEHRRRKTKHKGGLIQTCFGNEICEAVSMMLKLRGNPREGPLFVTHKGKRMTRRFINDAIKRLAKEAEINNGFQTKDLRDFFGDALDHAGVTGKVKQIMMGRVPFGAEKHYRTSKYTIIDKYKLAYVYLKINSIPRPKEERQQVADAIMRLTKIIASPQPKIEAVKWIEEIQKVSMDFAGPTSFGFLLKRALKNEGA